jgi:hypothetical protein
VVSLLLGQASQIGAHLPQPYRNGLVAAALGRSAGLLTAN